MSGTRGIPYLPTEIPMEIPNDLPVPSTTRALQPRSRATSLARSEARSASGSRPGSRSGSLHSRASSSSRSKMAEVGTTMDTSEIQPPALKLAETGEDEVEVVNDVVEPASVAGPSTISAQTGDGGSSSVSYESLTLGLPPRAPSSMDQSWLTTSESSDWQFTGASQTGGASHGELGRTGSAPLLHSSMGAGIVDSVSLDETSTWGADGLNGAPIRLGFHNGGPSGSGAESDRSTSKRKRSTASSSPEEPLSQRSWRVDLNAETEVADQLLIDDASDVPLSQLSTSSSNIPEKSRKGKGKARAQTPDPASVIVIPDTPPSTHKEILPPPPPQPEPLSSYTCPICFSQPTNATLTPCGHICCGACLFAAVKTTLQRGALAHTGPALSEARCPVCRASIPGWDGKGGGVIGLKARAIFRL